jgi:hypothetical protein
MVHQQNKPFAEGLIVAGSPQSRKLFEMLAERVDRVLIAMTAEQIPIMICQIFVAARLIVRVISLSQPKGKRCHGSHNSTTPNPLLPRLLIRRHQPLDRHQIICFLHQANLCRIKRFC